MRPGSVLVMDNRRAFYDLNVNAERGSVKSAAGSRTLCNTKRTFSPRLLLNRMPHSVQSQDQAQRNISLVSIAGLISRRAGSRMGAAGRQSLQKGLHPRSPAKTKQSEKRTRDRIRVTNDASVTRISRRCALAHNGARMTSRMGTRSFDNRAFGRENILNNGNAD